MMILHKKGLSDPNEWEHVQFMNNEGNRYLNEMDKDIAEVDEDM